MTCIFDKARSNNKSYSAISAMDIAEQYAECMNQCIQDAATAEKRLEAANAQIEQLKQRLAVAYKACRKLLADHKELFCLVKMVVFHELPESDSEERQFAAQN
eukprot:COSAG01_NODE_6516_length_3625_cov_5.544243_4_plen_103_part_00